MIVVLLPPENVIPLIQDYSKLLPAESSLNPRAINHNRNDRGKIISTDYGIMQINSTHIPGLKKWALSGVRKIC